MSGPQRKLPPDDALLQLRRDGARPTDIAARYGVTPSAVNNAVARIDGRVGYDVSAPHNLAGHNWSAKTREHRETTGYAPAVTHDEYPGTDAHALELHECRDLLREWGAVQ